MHDDDFLDSPTGILVPTSGTERVVAGGKVRYEPFTGKAFLPHPLPPQGVDMELLIGRLWKELDTATSGLRELDGLARTMDNPHLISGPFRIREAQASSRIENTLASAEDIAAGDDGIELRDEPREVRNYLWALDEGLASDAPIGEWLIRSMHRTLLEGTRGEEKRPGQYREGQAYIAGASDRFRDARFVPPPAERVAECMGVLSGFLSSPPEAIPPVLAIAFAHYQFETIHPFADGNGRLGRMLIVLQMCRSGLVSRPLVYVSSFIDRHRDVYYDLLLRVSSEGAWEDWLRFFCQAVGSQAVDGIRRTERLLDLRRGYLVAVTEPRAPAMLREVVDQLFARPVVRVSTLAMRIGVRPQQAQRYISRLEEKGILTETTGGGYGRVYVAKGVIELIESDEISET